MVSDIWSSSSEATVGHASQSPLEVIAYDPDSREDFDVMEEYIVVYRALTIQEIHGFRVNSMEIWTNHRLEKSATISSKNSSQDAVEQGRAASQRRADPY